MYKCEICQREFSSLGGLHGHIKKTHSWTQEGYYHNFQPRYDKYDHELISYKSFDQYLSTDFNSRENFVEWFTENRQNPYVKEYCIGKLIERAERKNYFVVPSQCSLKSLFLPSLLGFEKLYGDLSVFFGAVKKHNLTAPFDYSSSLKFKEGQMTIVQDTREKLPLPWNCSVEVMKIPCGDYFPKEPFFSNVAVERKGAYDLVNTLGTSKERFIRELEKARELGFYLVVVIEDLYSEILQWTSSNRYSRKITGAHIMHEMRNLSEKYSDVVQFTFAGCRKRAVELIEKIFRLGSSVRTVDLEYFKDKGVL